MSHTIHYFGRLRKPELLSELQEEFGEFAQVSGWSHEIVDHVFPREDGEEGARQTLRGIRIQLTPSDGPVRFTFDQEGYLSHLYYEAEAPAPVSMERPLGRLTHREAPGFGRVLHHVHTHTTFRSKDPRAHLTLVKLLDHLGNKYVPNLEVIDNTGYWTSRDEKALEFRPLVTLAP
jgi:hypothetical protein